MRSNDMGNSFTRHLMGDEQSAKLIAASQSGTFGAAVAEYAVDHVFEDIWTREGLDQARRSLITMTVMVALRQPHEFGLHMGFALDHGMPLKEIEEALIQMLPYVGFPAISGVMPVAAKIIAERGLDRSEEYEGHRGLL